MSLPTFPPFPVHSQNEQSAGLRWKKWLEKFENMIAALDVTDDKRKRALLLHYIGDETYNIFDNFTDEQKGIGATVNNADGVAVSNEYKVAKDSLTNYFTPKKNTTFEIFKFRQASQASGETIDSYHTRLRTLTTTCEFHNTDNEILSQIVQGCTSARLRRKALRDNFTLEQILDEARALELAETRASFIEDKGHSTAQSSVNAVTNTTQNNSENKRHKHQSQNKRWKIFTETDKLWNFA